MQDVMIGRILIIFRFDQNCPADSNDNSDWELMMAYL